MKTKHTPGPWQCTKYPKVFSINALSGRQIAIMTEHHGDCPMVPMSQFERSEQDAADARLIAAAPEMFTLVNALANIGEFADQHSAEEFKRTILTLSSAAKVVRAKAEGGDK